MSDIFNLHRRAILATAMASMGAPFLGGAAPPGRKASPTRGFGPLKTIEAGDLRVS